MRWELFAVVGVLALCAGAGLWVATREQPSEQPPENLPTQPPGATAELPTLRVSDEWVYEFTAFVLENYVIVDNRMENLEYAENTITVNFKVENTNALAEGKDSYLLEGAVDPTFRFICPGCPEENRYNRLVSWVEKGTLLWRGWEGLKDNRLIDNPAFPFELSRDLWPLEVGKELTLTEPRPENIPELVYNLRIELENLTVPARAEPFECFKIAFYKEGDLLGSLWYSPEVKFYVKLDLGYFFMGADPFELRSYSLMLGSS